MKRGTPEWDLQQALFQIARITYEPMNRDSKASLEKALDKIQRIANIALKKEQSGND